MDISRDEVEYISSTLETQAVTYHTAARDLNIHVSKSKQMLLDYYNVNKGRVTASFVVTGTRQGNTVVQMFQDEANFTSQSEKFDEIRTVHVYCLTLAKNLVLTSEIALEELNNPIDLNKLAYYYDLGLTKGTDIYKVESSAKVNKRVPADIAQPAVKQDTKIPEAAKPKLEYQSRKEKPKTPSMIPSYVSRKGEASKHVVPAKREAGSKPTYQYKSRKTEQSQPKERVVISSMEDDDMHLDPPAAPAEPVDGPTAVKSDLNNLFLDDLSDFSDDTKDNVEEPIMVETRDQDAEMDDEIAEKANSTQSSPQVPEDSIFRTLATSNSSASPTPQRTPSPPPQTTVDEDGYITTYRAKEPVPRKAPAREPVNVAKPSTKKSDGKKKQASLMSFFGKR